MDNRKLGFCTDYLAEANRVLRIGIIDADLLDNGTRHPNLALLKISGYCKSLGHNVRLICSYDEIRESLIHNEIGYDVLAMSKVFKFTSIPVDIVKMIDDGRIYIGGTGFFEINGPRLPDNIEHHMPDYHLYDEYIDIHTGGDPNNKRKWSDYLDFSIGFTTRGCIRHCGFCVNRLLNKVDKWSPVSEFLDPSRPRIYLWDDNIMAAPPHVFKEVLDDLVSTGKPFQFRQGMDIRLMTEEKAQLLSKVKYYGDYIFAFDHYRLDEPNERKQVEQTLKGLEIWRKYCKKSTKLYVLVAYDSQDETDIVGTFYRIRKLMEYGCLPYIMRFEKYKDSEYRDMYIQIARWCNQPSFFKKMSFRQYCVRNEEFHQGINTGDSSGHYNTEVIFPLDFNRKSKYCTCYQTMLNFERRHPEIAKEFFDLRFEDLNIYNEKQ